MKNDTADMELAATLGNNGRPVLGGMAKYLMDAGFKTNALRTNDALRFYEWQAYDQALIREAIRPQRCVNATKTLANY